MAPSRWRAWSSSPAGGRRTGGCSAPPWWRSDSRASRSGHWRPRVPGYLGVAAEGPIRSIADLPPRAMSFLALLSSMPAMVYAMAVMTMLLAFPIAVAWTVWTVKREPVEMSALPLTFTLLVAIAGYALATTAFGGGIVDADRSNWLGSLSMLVAIGLLPLVIWQLSREILGARIAL